MNKRYKFIFNDTVFVLALGIIFAVIAINVMTQLIEILFRNNINYDEYDFAFDPGAVGIDMDSTRQEDDLEKCDAEIKAYVGNK